MDTCNIYLTIAYRQTGKDTLYKMLNGDSTIPFNWIVYGSHSDLPNLPFSSKLQRIAFADKLKEEVMEKLNDGPSLTHYNQSYLESHKDDKILPDDKSFRDHLIEHGLVRRKEKVNYWSETALKGAKGDVMVTDCRFADEIEEAKKHGKVLLIRLFRSSVNIPPLHEASEHSLDGQATDYLLVQSDDEFKLAAQLWPQYKDYIKLT